MSENKAPHLENLSESQGGTAEQGHNWGMFCHLSALLGLVWFPLGGFLLIPFGHILGPLIIWLVKKNEYPFVDRQGREALNFQISMTLYGTLSSILIFVLVGFVLLMGLAVVDVILVIIASVKASNGESYRYPFTIRFIK